MDAVVARLLENEPEARLDGGGTGGRAGAAGVSAAKVAVGCRNLACTFDDLVVRGLQTKKQAHNKVAETQQE